jgi:threonylcarbamoyladenosine tRNA methylthiotransferase MtaB
VNVFLDTIGCRLNQAEIEAMAQEFRLAGHEIVANAAAADMAVINTCSVTAEAASDSRMAIRRANRSGVDNVIVTGCWATLETEKALLFPGVSRVVLNSDKTRLARDLIGHTQEQYDLGPRIRQPIPGAHRRTRAFIKAQDGCDDACTYCITQVARGAGRSQQVDEVLKDVQAALSGEVKEVVLTGVQLGSWGHDLNPARNLSDLISALLAPGSVPRLRISSIEPWNLDPDFFQLWADPHLCRHLHLPLQSGSSSVLKRMRRRTSPEEYANLVSSARSLIPGIAITTDLITGFPGETGAEFDETMDFVKSMGFAGGHVFHYSPRPGTPAARMKGQVSSDLAKKRSALLRSILIESSQTFRRNFIGTTLPVLWEARSTQTATGWRIEGLTDNYIRVVAEAPIMKQNQLNNVFLKTDGPGYLIGEIQYERERPGK